MKQKTCRLPHDQGGHTVVNVDTKVKALHLSWIHSFLHGPEGKWKEFFVNNLNKFHNLKLGQDLLNAKLNNAGLRVLPKFYSEILNTWFSLEGRWSAPPQTRGEVLSEPIFFNKNILDTRARTKQCATRHAHAHTSYVHARARAICALTTLGLIWEHASALCLEFWTKCKT